MNIMFWLIILLLSILFGGIVFSILGEIFALLSKLFDWIGNIFDWFGIGSQFRLINLRSTLWINGGGLQ